VIFAHKIMLDSMVVTIVRDIARTSKPVVEAGVGCPSGSGRYARKERHIKFAGYGAAGSNDGYQPRSDVPLKLLIEQNSKDIPFFNT
jgi:hypothetical protein